MTLKSIRDRLTALEPQAQALVFRARLRKARRATDFAEALWEATRVGPDSYALDLAQLTEEELLALAGGEQFAMWWEGLGLHGQLAFARGEMAAWREAKA
jgi:hypothetical protein